MILWILAEGQPYLLPVNAYECRKNGCQSKDCREEYSNPIDLPELVGDIPQYWKDIICACRKHDPRHRPPAWKLLEKFPPEFDSKLSPSRFSTAEGAMLKGEDLNLLFQRVDHSVICNLYVTPVQPLN